MNNMTKILGAAALGLGVAVAIPVLGHGFGAGMHGPYGSYGGYGGGWGPGHHMGMHYGPMNYGLMHHGGNIEQHLNQLKESLKLTANQQPAWDQFEQAVKTMMENGPAGHPYWDNGSSNADEHYNQMEQHFTQMKAMFDAHKALYDALTDQQRQTLDNYMPGPYGHHHGYNG